MLHAIPAHLKAFLLAGAGLAAIAAAPSARAAPSYVLSQTLSIPVAASNASGKFTGYDLSTFDPATQLYYLTDRSNNGIDVFSSKTDSFVERIGSGLFAGTAGGNNDVAGPNGITIADVGGGKLLTVGDSPSRATSFTLLSDGLTVAGAPRSVSTAVTGTPTPANRVDGVGYAPAANTILAANNASAPGFLTLIDNGTGTVTRSILLNGTGGYPNVNGDGVEAVVFNTATGTFFVAVPKFNGSGAGGVIELDPTTGALLNTYDFNALGLSGGCGPTGVAQGAGASMLVACGDNPTNQSILLDPTGAGSIKTIAQVAGGDQVAFDPARDLFFEAARYQAGGPVLGVIDGATGNWIENLPITYNDHSVAVDPVTGQVFVAFGAGTPAQNPYCGATGCIGVFSPVPEPASLALLTVGVLGLGWAMRRRRG